MKWPVGGEAAARGPSCARSIRYSFGMDPKTDLQALRRHIEEVDREILSKLQHRMELAERVARTKVAAATAFRDPPREEQVLQRVRQMATELGLDAHIIERMYRLIMDMSVSRQQAYVHGLETIPLRVVY